MPSPQRPGAPHHVRADGQLLAHRVVILVLMVAVAGLSLGLLRLASKKAVAPDEDRTIPPLRRETVADVIAMDLGARVEEIARAGWPDGSETYFASGGASVHMHLLGYGQMVPLHIHPAGEEATIIVTGAPEVVQVHGAPSGVPIRDDAVRREGTLIYSPPSCGHKWVNHDREHMQGNLVFSVPQFPGNLYVEEDDPRLRGGGAPAVFTADALLDALPEGLAFDIVTLPIMNGRMRALVLRNEAEVPAAPGTRMLYVARGRAVLRAAGGAEIRARTLLELPPSLPVRIRALEPTVAFLFDPAASG